jgi:hypothetical protein
MQLISFPSKASSTHHLLPLELTGNHALASVLSFSLLPSGGEQEGYFSLRNVLLITHLENKR